MRNLLLARLILLASAGAALAACTVPNKERGELVISSLPLSKAGTTGGCACPDPGSSKETLFAPFRDQFAPCMILENRMPNNANVGPGRVNTNDLILENLHVSYEATGPAPVNVPDQNIPANGTVAAGAKASIPVLIVPPNVMLSLPVGQGVRVYVYGQGRLLDGSRVRTSTYEYIAFRCFAGSPGCGTDTCNGP